jgi:hypothetical protein
MKRSLFRSLSWSLTVTIVWALSASSCTPTDRNFGTGGSAGAGGDGGSGGSPMACIPDTKETCYSGPPETLEVGLCKSGMHVCLPSGTGFGECGGETLPKPENCLTPEDEACNGNDPKECPSLSDGWLKAFGSVGFAQTVQDIAITPDGNIVVVGSFVDTIDFGIGPMASTGSHDMFIAKFDPLGNAIWNRRFGDASAQIAHAVAVDNMGSIYVGGSIAGSVDFNGTLFTSAGSDDAFVARFDADGNFAWARVYGDSSRQYVRHIEITKTNLIVVAGEFFGVLQLDANNYMSFGNTDIFLARFDTSGFLAGSRAYGGQGIDTVRGLALDSLDNVYITGGFESTLDFKPPLLASTGARDAYIAQLTPTLNPMNALSFGDPNGPTNSQEGYDLAINSADQVFMTGGFSGGIDLAGTFFSNPDTTARSLFIARFEPGLAAPPIANQYGGIGGAIPEARAAIDPVAKQLVIGGAFTGQVDFGGGLIAAEASHDPFFAKFNFDGSFVSSRTLPNEIAVIDNSNNINALALLPGGDLIIGGVQRTPILFGPGVVGTTDGKDGNAFLGRFIH